MKFYSANFEGGLMFTGEGRMTVDGGVPMHLHHNLT